MSKLEKICAAFFVALILCWMTFDNLIGIRFTNYDDMWFSVVSFKDYFAVAGEDATNTGRFGMYYATAYLMITNALWNTPILDIASYGSVAAVMVGILALAHYLGHVRLGLLFVTLYLSFIPVTYHFNLLVSYPFRYTSGILLWLAALFSIETYLRNKKSGYLWFACALSFVAYTHHETLFAIFASTNIIFAVLRQNGGALKQRLSHPATLALLATSLVYAGVFVAWYVAHPTTYAGNTIKIDAVGFLSGYANAVAYYVFASLPLFHFFNGYVLPFIVGGTDLYSAVAVAHDFVSVIGNIEAGQIARSCLVAVIFFITIDRLPPRISSAALKGITAIGLAILILPAAIISFSQAYQLYVQGGYAPLHITFFSYFGSILLICTAIIFVLKYLSPNLQKLASYGLALIIGVGALTTDVFNTQVSEAMHLNSARWNVAATLMRHLQARNNDSSLPKLIIAPQLWDVAGSPGALPEKYWQRLFKLKTGLDIQFSPLQLSDMPELSATLYYDCPKLKNCLIMLQHQQNRMIEVISTSPRPRFLTYSENNAAKTINVVPTLQQLPTLLYPGIYITTLPANFTELSKWRIEM
jgi:hypothetical protein